MPELALNSVQIETSLHAIASAFVDFTIATLLLALLTALVLQALYDFRLRRRINYDTTHRWLEARWALTKDRMRKLLEERPESRDENEAAIARLNGAKTDALLEEIGIGVDSPIYALPFPQTCAQISASLNSANDWRQAPLVLLAFAGVGKSESEMRPGPRIQPNPLDKNLRWAASLLLPEESRSEEERAVERQEVMSRIEHAIDNLQSEIATVWSTSVYKWSLRISLALLVLLAAAAVGLNIDLSSLVIFPIMVGAATLLAPPLQRVIGRLLVAS